MGVVVRRTIVAMMMMYHPLPLILGFMVIANEDEDEDDRQ